MAEKMAGAPPNKGETQSFQVTLPKRLYDYLGRLAQQSFIGVSESDVASYLLRKELESKLESGFHRLEIPKPDCA